MNSRTHESILVLGGGNVERAPSGWATKSAIAKYLHDLADEFGHVTWMVQASGTWGVSLVDAQHDLQGVLDPDRITVVPFDYRLRHAPRLWHLLLRTVRGHDYGMFFLPAAVSFAPVIRLATRRMKKSASYLAGDYIDAADKISSDRWLGWSTLQRWAHILVLRQCNISIARGHKLAEAAGRYADTVFETIPIANISFAATGTRDPNERVANRVLYVGVVAESKGVGVLIDSVKSLLDAGREVSLEVCGDGPDRERFEKRASDRGVDSAVRFLGWVDDPARLDRAFEQASVLVMPSTTHPEGVPRVIDEAIARGIPVVSTTAGGVGEEFENGEIRLVEPGSMDELSAAIEAVLFDPASRTQLLESARKRRDWLLESGTAGQQHARLLRS